MPNPCGCTNSTFCPEGRRLWDVYVALTNFARQTDRLGDYERAEAARRAWAAHYQTAMNATRGVRHAVA